MSGDTEVHLVTLVIVDHDDMGAEEVKAVLKNTRYPNHCLAGLDVLSIRTEEVDWTDDHPLNMTDGWKAAAVKLFGDAEETIRHLRRHRFSLAAALGYNTKYESNVPIHKELIRQVRTLVEMRDRLNDFRRFMKEET